MFTDFNAPNIKNIRIIEGHDNNWGINLANCIQSSNISRTHKYIFVLIEDLIPTSKVNFDVIDMSIMFMEQNQIDCTVFPTFKCYWGPAIGGISLNDSKLEFYDVPTYFNYYSQLQPAIWKLDYFKKLLNINNEKMGILGVLKQLTLAGDI